MTVNLAIKKLTSITSSSATKLRASIGRPLWRILTFSPADDSISPKKIISASLEKDTLSIAYASRFLARIKIKGFREYSFEEGRYPQPEGLASSLALAIKDLGAAGADVTLSIPKAWAIIKTAEFPATVKENLSDAVSYELDRLTPFSPENAFYDFKILGESSGKLTILTMAAKFDLVKPYLEALKEKGITVSRVIVNLSGLGTLYRYLDKEKDFIYIELKEDGYEGALFLDGSVTGAFTGSFSAPPSPSLARGGEESKINTLMTEIDPFVVAVRKHGKTPRILALLKDKSSTLKELLKLQIKLPVRILNETDIKPRFSLPDKEIPGAVIGGALESLWPKANGLNLLKKGYHDIQKTPVAFTVILIILIIVMWILYMIAPLRLEEKRLKEIDRQIMMRKEDVRKAETLKKELDSLSNEIATINNFKGNRLTALNIFKELTSILPNTTWLTRARITESTVDIEGYASSASMLLPKLEASNYFKKAEFASPTFRDARMNADRFNIKMELEGFKKDEGEVPKNENK